MPICDIRAGRHVGISPGTASPVSVLRRISGWQRRDRRALLPHIRAALRGAEAQGSFRRSVHRVLPTSAAMVTSISAPVDTLASRSVQRAQFREASNEQRALRLKGQGYEIGLSLSVIPDPFDSRLAARGCLLETGLGLAGEMRTGQRILTGSLPRRIVAPRLSGETLWLRRTARSSRGRWTSSS